MPNTPPSPAPSKLSSAGATSPRSENKTHENWVDIFRGFAILGVVFIHILPRFYRFHPQESAPWWTLFTAQRLCFYAVPGFLLLSALMNTRSLLKKPDLTQWGSYLRTRLLTVVWPYLIWSFLYIAYQRYGVSRGYSFAKVPEALRWGTSWPHLYFFIVLLQLLVFLPIVVALLRQVKKPCPLWGIIVLTFVLSAAVYFANRHYLHLTRPGSNLLWYLPCVLPGIWLGFQKADDITRGLKNSLVFTLIAALTVAVAYRNLAAANTLGLQIDTMHYQAAEWSYGTAASLLLMGVAIWLCEQPALKVLVAPLTLCGRYSFPIYLIHPLVLVQLDTYRESALPKSEPILLLIYSGLGIALPMAITFAADKLRVSPLLFGRKTS